MKFFNIPENTRYAENKFLKRRKLPYLRTKNLGWVDRLHVCPDHKLVFANIDVDESFTSWLINYETFCRIDWNHLMNIFELDFLNFLGSFTCKIIPRLNGVTGLNNTLKWYFRMSFITEHIVVVIINDIRFCPWIP